MPAIGRVIVAARRAGTACPALNRSEKSPSWSPAIAITQYLAAIVTRRPSLRDPMASSPLRYSVRPCTASPSPAARIARAVASALAAERLVLKITVTPILRSAASTWSAPGTGATAPSPVFSHASQSAAL